MRVGDGRRVKVEGMQLVGISWATAVRGGLPMPTAPQPPPHARLADWDHEGGMLVAVI